jgi:hypothetical protein
LAPAAAAAEQQWIAEHITRHLARTSSSFQSMFNRDLMPRFSMRAVRADMQEKMLSVFRKFVGGSSISLPRGV